MQTLRNWLSLKTEALRFPRIFTLARRGLKPISNDSSQTIKYILSISVLILNYIPKNNNRHENWIPRETTRIQTRQHRVEECQKGYLEQHSKRSEQLEKCPLSARAGFYQYLCDTFYKGRATLLTKEGRHFSLRRMKLQQCRTTFLKRGCNTGKCRATFL